MVNKSSFGRGLNSSMLNSYVLNVILCCSISVFLFILSITNSSFIKSARYNVMSIGKPFFIFVQKPFQLINQSITYFDEVTKAKKINEELIKENKALKKQLDKNNFLILENRRLKNIMDIKEVDYLKKITARILIDAYKDDGSILYIDVGKNDGLKINDVVFNEKGLIGRVIELGSNSSKVLTIFNQNSIIPVTSIESKKSFFVQGRKERLELKHVEQKFDLKHGEIVVSTDAAGYFKEGIKIGRIFKTLNDVFLIPFAKNTDSIYVNVLIYNFKKEFKD